MKIRRIIKAFSWLLGAALFFTAMGFAHSESGEARATALEISVIQPEGQYFLTRTEVDQHISNENDSLIGTPLELINTALLEESLENHPFIRNAEVYFTLSGRVSAEVEQHRVIARVSTPQGDNYMNSYGEPVPLSNNHSADVPMITGKIDSSQWREAHRFLGQLDRSPWLRGRLEAIVLEDNGQFVVYPRFGRHSIRWGTTEETETKIGKLEVFYRYLTDKERMDEIRTIDVRFNGQVVSTNH